MLLDGKKLSLEIQSQIAKKIELIEGRKPTLAFILVGDNSASLTYVNAKKKACHAVGMVSKTIELPKTIAEIDLLKQIESLNKDPNIDGILVQLPLPNHIDEKIVFRAIDPKKDVDGFHPINVGKMLLGDDDGFLPCTPSGIKVLLDSYKIPIAGKHVVILGRSNIVGKPLAAILMQKKIDCNATVTIAHSQSEHLKELTRSADILVAAMGKPKFIKKDFVKKGSTVIDVGINRFPDGKLVGDVDFKEVEPVVENITPVPGGIGPMTIAMLLKNTLSSFLKFAFVCLFFLSCQKQTLCTHFEGEAMTMPYHIIIGKILKKQELHSVQNIIKSTFDEIHGTFDNWNPSSEVSKLNEAKSETLIPLSPSMQDLLAFCQEMVFISGNRFDPTIGPLLKVWQNRKPSPDELQEACDAVGFHHLSIHNGILKKDNAATHLDFCGVAKGVCIDLLVERFQKIGLTDFIIEWAGDFRALGHHPNNSDWLVQISPALTIDQKPMAPIALRNAALSMSRRPFEIIDPMTASPIEKTPFSVAFATVIAPTSTLADCLATTALLFATRKEAEHWAQEIVEKYPDVKFWILSYK